LSHLSGMSAGDPVIIKKELSPTGLAYEMGQKINAFNGVTAAETVSMGVQTYDPLWWSVQRLEQLDALIRPAPPAPEPKQRDLTPPTYSSPTQSFIAKVTSPGGRRAVSSMSNLGNGSPRPISRAPTPPPPEVDWTVAAHELSKILIPIDRQTMSCKPEDLSAEATRARRDRQSIITPPTSNSGSEPLDNPSQRMALRARKPAKPLVETVEEDDAKKPAAKTNRRKTVAGAAIIAAEKVCFVLKIQGRYADTAFRPFLGAQLRYSSQAIQSQRINQADDSASFPTQDLLRQKHHYQTGTAECLLIVDLQLRKLLDLILQ
jgi:histone deacetylase HOS3